MPAEHREIGLGGLSQATKAAFGCPIAFEQRAQVVALPQGRADHGPEAAEAMPPTTDKTGKAQQHVTQERVPELPTHRVGIVAQEVPDLQRLFDLLEEDLNLPATAVEFGHAARRPLQVVGQKD